jgi:hypothetical protein
VAQAARLCSKWRRAACCTAEVIGSFATVRTNLWITQTLTPPYLIVCRLSPDFSSNFHLSL